MIKRLMLAGLVVWVVFIFAGGIKEVMKSNTAGLKAVTDSIFNVESEIVNLKAGITDKNKQDIQELGTLRTLLNELLSSNSKLRGEFEEYANFQGKADIFKEKMLSPTVQVRYDNASGAGVVIRKERADSAFQKIFVITAFHTIKDYLDDKTKKNDIIVYLYDENERYQHIAWIYKFSKELDLAILTFETRIDNVSVAKFVRKDKVKQISVYDPVITIGCPLGYDPIATEGRITSFKKEIKGNDFWLMNCPTVYGNSGGGVFLKKTGELIGIANMICTYDGIISTPVYHMSIFLPISVIFEWLDGNEMAFLYDTETEAGTARLTFEQKKR
ncbi:MAG: trypsin-like peptidase domain-containing protein [Planctomycetes bacterium]|nr:trypsin-like peptidase domain-containing protein [Planctomycetota bacterium]